MSHVQKVLILLLTIFSYSALAQKDTVSLNKIVEKTVKLAEQRPVEKLHLHFDKPYYALGDTIWFKAYLTMNMHEPSPYSKIVYVEMIAGQDSVVETLKLPVVNSGSSGSFTLSPMHYNQGNYRIRAYTIWMYNFGEDYFFNKNIVIGDAIEKQLETQISFPAAPKNSQVSAAIYYRDENKRPYADRKVSWKVVLDYETILKGRDKTDANGFLRINIPEYKKATLNKASLVTTLEASESRSMSSSFPLIKAFADKDLKFFPEGGELINELPTTIAVKAIKSDGLGIDFKGKVVDSDGNSLDFQSQHLGMGSFILTPEVNKTYKATVIFADGTTASYDLPRAKVAGASIKVSSSNEENLNIRIASSTAHFKQNQGNSFYLIARSGGVVCYAAQFKLQSQVFTAAIPKNKFPVGIAQISLLDATGQVLSERLSFVYRKEELSVSLKTDKGSYLAGQRVKVNLAAKKNNLAAEGNFSVAVIDESRVPVNEDSETTILTSLLLNAELKGYIEQPNYYFREVNDKKLGDLDVLLLTQGYRSFTYEQIIKDTYPKLTFLPEEGINISGVLRMNTGMPVSKGNVRLIIPDKRIGISAVTDMDGRFKFSNVVFNDSSKVTLSALNNINSKNMVFTIDGSSYAGITFNPVEADQVLNIDSSLNSYISNSKKQYFDSRMLKEVVIKSRVIEKKASHADYASLTGLGMMANHEISADRFKGCSNFLQCLQGSAMGLVFENNNFYISRNYNAGNRTPVQIYVRDMPVDVVFLNSVNPSEVESVEIFNSDGLSGINRRTNTSGVLVVNIKEVKKSNMKFSDLKDLFPSTNQITFNPKGYSTVRQFYSPKFDVTPTLNRLDLRTTVYWNPEIVTDATGSASFDFLTASKGTYRTVIEGIDKEGKLARAVYRLVVK